MQLQTLFSLFLAFAGMGIAAPTNAGPKDVSDTKDITTGSDAVTPMGWNDWVDFWDGLLVARKELFAVHWWNIIA
ncbi:hypothetical protein Purlil1_9136 [Purpureocillium lilacinum]|uniref:Uncharacterized protein n=1 Tax=Purpureocillium lilacinum TaxID=33203 RepID=A0ABR0BRA6_PURLI|nr:hypothetical protein Purlil1_9136 [Purpureocillium lilacinum]